MVPLFTSCSYAPNTDSYHNQYSHLNQKFIPCTPPESPYFLVILVDARHLDYSNPNTIFNTLAKHPSDGSKNGDVGHSWIYLQGYQDNQPICIEGGHSGETGQYQPKYMEGVFQQLDEGNENPISYLWETQKDGFFQYGSGNHIPTFAARIDLSPEQFSKILKYIENYNYKDYAITGNQCCSFAAQIATFAGVDLDCQISMPVENIVYLKNKPLCLWTDPVYAEFCFFSPDILEKSLMQAVQDGHATYALPWYMKQHCRCKRFNFDDVIQFPRRITRYLYLAL